MPKQVIEASTKLQIPGNDKVFFNPEMKLNRDITVSVIKAWPNKRTVCDALAGTGAKGIRIANETTAELVVLNDKNPNARKTILANAKLNNLDNVKVEEEDANILLSKSKYSKFNVIDIDPFGSPATFIDSACRALLPKDALLCVTATDTGALCGTFSNSALRKYGLKLKRTSFYNELGIRALIAFCVREAAKYEIGLKPMLCHSTRHYYRVFLKTLRGKEAAVKSLKNTSMIYYCYECGERSYQAFECHNVESLGPIWSKGLYDAPFLKTIEPVSDESEKLLSAISAEYDADLPYYDLHVIWKKAGVKSFKFDKLIEKLKASDYKVSRTHLSKHSIRTNAPLELLLSL